MAHCACVWRVCVLVVCALILGTSRVSGRRGHSAPPAALQPTEEGAMTWASLIDGDLTAFLEGPSGAGGSAGSAGKSGGAAGTSGGSAGTSAGAAGTSGGAAGTAAGAAGTAAGSAGKKGAAAGTSGGAAGTSGGASGTSAGASGTSGGSSGAASKVVVAPTAASSLPNFPSYNGSLKFKKGEKNVTEKTCRIFGEIYIDRYIAKGRDILRAAFDAATGELLVSFCKGGNSYWGANVIAYSRYKLMTQTYNLIIHDLGKAGDTIQANNYLVGSDAGAIDNQQTCGSCWVQTAIDSLEIALMKEKRYKGPLSVQQVLDCVHTAESSGCQGGSPLDALEWLQANPPILKSFYPATATGIPGACRTAPGKDLAGKVDASLKSNGWEPLIANYSSDDVGNAEKYAYVPCTTGGCGATQNLQELDMVLQVASVGPFFTYVDTQGWDRYKSGVFPPNECRSDPQYGNHLVQLIGVGKLNEQPVWVLKNSWGTSWGVNGLIYLPIGYNACGVANFVARASVRPEFEPGARSAAEIGKMRKSSLAALTKGPPKVVTPAKGKKASTAKSTSTSAKTSTTGKAAPKAAAPKAVAPKVAAPKAAAPKAASKATQSRFL